jgi:MFS family permease
MSAVADPLAEPVHRVRRGWISLIALANLGLFMGYFGPLSVLLPNQVQDVAGASHKVLDFGLVTGIGAVVAVVANPLAGALSDRTAGPFGRRHPWTLGGALVSAAAMLLLASQHTVAGIVVGWCVAQAGLNAMQAGLAAGVPDRVPVGQRGAVSGWIGIPTTAGVVIAVVLVSDVVTGNAGYVLLAACTVGFALPFVFATSDARLTIEQRAPFRIGEFARSFWLSPARYPDFGWAWLTRFLMVLGNSMAVLYLLYFLRDRIKYSQLFPGQKAESGLAILLLVYTVVAVVTMVAAGIVSDRTGRRRRSVAVAGVVMAVPAVLLALWPTWPTTLAAAAILGVGFGTYLSVDQALITQVLPQAAGRAKDLGMISVASSAGQALAPALAAPLVTYLGGYSTLFFCVAGIVRLGSVAVWRIRSVR